MYEYIHKKTSAKTSERKTVGFRDNHRPSDWHAKLPNYQFYLVYLLVPNFQRFDAVIRVNFDKSRKILVVAVWYELALT